MEKFTTPKFMFPEDEEGLQTNTAIDTKHDFLKEKTENPNTSASNENLAWTNVTHTHTNDDEGKQRHSNKLGARVMCGNGVWCTCACERVCAYVV